MNKIYLITVDNSYPFDTTIFHNYIANTLCPTHITSWWHYVSGGTYFVCSSLSVNQLYNLIYPVLPGRHFIIMEVEPKNQQGWLPQKAWDWFKNFR